MNANIINPFTCLSLASMPSRVLPALIAVLNLLPAGRVMAQTFTTLHSFTATTSSGPPNYSNTNRDGASAYAGLVANASGTTLYGMASQGGSPGAGTLFAVNTDGSGFTNLHSFAYTDGANPMGLTLSASRLYGTTSQGGSWGYGTVFAVSTDGTGFTNLQSFSDGADGGFPNADLILSSNTLYGTAYSGGLIWGTVFALNTNGTGFTVLHTFSGGSDGAYPRAGLLLSSNTLYGTASSGGSDYGTVFALKTDATGFTNLHAFHVSDGIYPSGCLCVSSNTLFGTTAGGGSSNGGTVFALNTDGTDFRTLHSFTGPAGAYQTNSDGWQPFARLFLSGKTLYGTAPYGGSSGVGTVFALNTDGTGFTVLHTFSGGSDGAYPWASLILSGDSLYGTAVGGGGAGAGTVFSVSFRPQLTITVSGTNVILSWPTKVAGFDYTGYTLQDTTNLVSSAVWSTNSPPPVVVNGQNTITNPISGAQQFYRLKQ